MQLRPRLGRAGAGALAVMAALALLEAAGQPVPMLALAQSLNTAATTGPVSAGSTGGAQRFVDRALSSELEQPAPPISVVVSMVPPGRGSLRIPIVMYHYIRINPDYRDKMGFNLSVTPDDFRAQMDWLAANGYNPIDFNDLRAYWGQQVALPPKPVILTFDDGYADVYTTAFPILRQHGFKGVAYIVSGFVGSRQNVGSDQVQDMDRNGIQIGAHTFSHADLTRASPADLQRQLVDSKASLEALVGHPVLDFAYPSGLFNQRVIDAVSAAGYQTATTTQPGTLHGLTDRFQWTRVRVSGGEGLDRFAADLAASEPTVSMTITRPAPSRPVPAWRNLPRVPLTVGRTVLRAMLPGVNSILRPPPAR